MKSIKPKNDHSGTGSIPYNVQNGMEYVLDVFYPNDQYYWVIIVTDVISNISYVDDGYPLNQRNPLIRICQSNSNIVSNAPKRL